MFQDIVQHEVSFCTSIMDGEPGFNEKVRVVARSSRYASPTENWVFRTVIGVTTLEHLTDDDILVRMTLSSVALPF